MNDIKQNYLKIKDILERISDGDDSIGREMRKLLDIETIEKMKQFVNQAEDEGMRLVARGEN